MKIIFLGTNGWYGTQTGNTTCTFVDSKDCYIIFDAGDGIYKAKEYITENKPVYLFLSHLHLDHISGLHIFPSFTKEREIHIILEKGNRDLLKSILRHPFMVPFKNDPFFYEILEEKYDEPLSFECLKLKHADPAMGYRIYLENKIIAYCLDTGICDNVYKLSQNADILITECSMLPDISNQEWGHLNPEEAAEIAKKSQVKKMIMTHMSVSYKSVEERKKAEKIAQKIFKNSLVAEDGLIIKI